VRLRLEVCDVPLRTPRVSRGGVTTPGRAVKFKARSSLLPTFASAHWRTRRSPSPAPCPNRQIPGSGGSTYSPYLGRLQEKDNTESANGRRIKQHFPPWLGSRLFRTRPTTLTVTCPVPVRDPTRARGKAEDVLQDLNAESIGLDQHLMPSAVDHDNIATGAVLALESAERLAECELRVCFHVGVLLTLKDQHRKTD